jgi:hypothetical protein
LPAIPWSALLAADEAIKRANEAARRKADTRPLIEHLPPIIRIANPSDGAHVQTNTVTLDYAVRSPSGQAVDRLDLLINMALLDERKIVSTASPQSLRAETP